MHSLYFHIPFCTKKCDYCHFYVIPNRDSHKELLLKALKMHWDSSPKVPKTSPCSIYFGGGTPSLMDPEAISSILSWIPPGKDSEITLEVNPENGSFEKLKAFKESGINRVSIGVQVFDNDLLKILGRTHTKEAAEQAVLNARKAGIENISIDLMYDLPEQSLESWRESLLAALKLPITHFSLYNLTIEAHTVFHKKKESLLMKMPEDQVSFEMLQLTEQAAEQAGFQRYEISAFCKPGYHSVHNTGYWQDRPFLGFGPSAFSYWEGARFRNVSNLNRYAKALLNGQDPIDFHEKLSKEEKLKEKLAIGLRMIQGIDEESWPESIHKILQKLEIQDLIVREREKIRLTKKGLLFHDTVAEMIFETDR